MDKVKNVTGIPAYIRKMKVKLPEWKIKFITKIENFGTHMDK